mgnify:CR=1 FL=1
MDTLHPKTVLITGGTSGIGLAVAKLCLDNHYHVLIVGSSEQRAASAKTELKMDYPDSRVKFFYADLSIQKNIHILSKEIIEYLDEKCINNIDVLINNAGGVRDFFQLTEDLIEYQFALNHLSGVLLSYLLLSRLSNGIIIFTGSYSHIKMKIHWKDLMYSKNYFIFTAYRQSKLANLMTAMAFNSILKPLNIHSYVVDPGLVNTQIANKHTTWLVRFVWCLKRKKGVNPLIPAKTYLFLIQNRPLDGIYYKDCIPVPYNPIADQTSEVMRLLRISEELCHIKFDNI